MYVYNSVKRTVDTEPEATGGVTLPEITGVSTPVYSLFT